MLIRTDGLAGYRIADQDVSGDPKYYGFTGPGGAWYILEENTTNGSFRYASGTSGYAAAWIGRAGLSYGYFHESV